MLNCARSCRPDHSLPRRDLAHPPAECPCGTGCCREKQAGGLCVGARRARPSRNAISPSLVSLATRRVGLWLDPCSQTGHNPARACLRRNRAIRASIPSVSACGAPAATPGGGSSSLDRRVSGDRMTFGTGEGSSYAVGMTHEMAVQPARCCAPASGNDGGRLRCRRRLRRNIEPGPDALDRGGDHLLVRQ